MKTVTVEIKNEIAMSFLHNLESMNIIRVVDTGSSLEKRRLSDRFAGCLPKDRVDELQKELIQMRNEWERTTY